MTTRPKGWAGLSLAAQFALAGGVVMAVAALVVGAWVTQRIEAVVVRNSANATALYMESFIAPITQGLSLESGLDEVSRAEIGRLLEETPLGERVVSFKLWRADGLLIDASNEAIVGQTFPLTENQRLAFDGQVRADFEDVVDPEDVAEAALGIPLIEIYSPIREGGSGRVIAVAEFYEDGRVLEQDLLVARASSWGTVALVVALIGTTLFAIVLRGSRTIDRQLVELTDLSARNVALRLRVQSAASRYSAMNDQALRRIGADLHDGPAQLMGFAALRLDGLGAALPDEKARADLAEVQRAVKDSILEIRNISRGLSLPDIDRRPIGTVLATLTEAHAARTKCPVALTVDLGGRSDVPVSVKILVYRFVQEGLTNAWRHAEGRGQEVRLVAGPDQLRLSVLDRGPGFSSATAAQEDLGGLGLAGLSDRVEALGGQFGFRNRDDGVPGAEIFMVIELKGAE